MNVLNQTISTDMETKMIGFPMVTLRCIIPESAHQHSTILDTEVLTSRVVSMV